MIIVEGLEMDSWTARGRFTPSDKAIFLGHGWSEMGLWILRKNWKRVELCGEIICSWKFERGVWSMGWMFNGDCVFICIEIGADERAKGWMAISAIESMRWLDHPNGHNQTGLVAVESCYDTMRELVCFRFNACYSFSKQKMGITLSLAGSMSWL